MKASPFLRKANSLGQSESKFKRGAKGAMMLNRNMLSGQLGSALIEGARCIKSQGAWATGSNLMLLESKSHITSS
jgi:hypothetical protein